MFKRVFILLVSIVLLLALTACYPLSLEPGSDNPETEPKPEILFCDIPWGSNPTVANELMGGQMYLGKDGYIKDWECAYDFYAAGVYQAGHFLTDTCTEVAGYPVSLTTMFFVYSLDPELDRSVEGSEFYLANYQFDVVDVDSAYDDLKSKLTALYGAGREECDTVTHSQWAVVGDGYSGEYDTLERFTIWTGGNNTQIVLMCSSLKDDVDVFSGDYLLLTYGKTDAEQRLNVVIDAVLEDMAKNEETDRDPQNTNGL